LKFAFEHLQELESDGGLPLLLKEQSDQWGPGLRAPLEWFEVGISFFDLIFIFCEGKLFGKWASTCDGEC
jgi:hypothetical protein